MTTAVVVDSSSGVTPALATQWGVHVVPLYIEWDGVTYRDEVDLLPAEFYSRLRDADQPPKTAAPSPADFLEVCEKLLDSGHDQVVIVTVSSKLSVTFQSASLVARQLGEDRITVVDTGTGAGAHALLAAEAAECAASGESADSIAATISELRDRAAVFVIMDTLKYLRRSGRISPAKAAAGTALHMNPVVGFTDGSLNVLARPLGNRRARSFVEEQLRARTATRALAMYTDDIDRATEWSTLLHDQFGVVRVDVGPLSTVVGANCGPGAHGVAVIWEADAP